MVFKRGKKGTWWYRFRFGGRFIHESAKMDSKTLAREAERQRRRQLEEKWNRVERRALAPTFEHASKEYGESRCHRIADSTASIDEHALKHLLPFFGKKLLCDIKASDISHYQARRREKGAEGRTVNMEIGLVRRVMRSYRLWDSLAPDVHMLTERKDIGRALAPVEEARLLEATRKTESACHTATVLALNTAIRKNEIRLLRWAQINWEQRIVAVGRSKTHAGTGRVIPLNADALQALVRWARRFPNAEPRHYVFPSGENEKYDAFKPTKGWRTGWRLALKRAGLKCRFHDLRVTCITKLSESQASEQTTMAIAGHVSRRMLEHYSRIRLDAKRQALEALAKGPEIAVSSVISEAGVNRNVNQIQ